MRINQVGFEPQAPKRALLMSGRPYAGKRFVVRSLRGEVVMSGRVGRLVGRWNSRFPYVYELDFSRLREPGLYRVRVEGSGRAVSPPFRITQKVGLYDPLLRNALSFYRDQRDGRDVLPGPLHREPSHLTDASAYIYQRPSYKNGRLQKPLVRIGGPIDVSGGWFDAGDYLKFVETASYTDLMMLLAARDYSRSFPPRSGLLRESYFGTDWLSKMWNGNMGRLFYQVGIGDGNGSAILGDHDFWRLPQMDDARHVSKRDPAYFVKYRPVFKESTSSGGISPNLAGRMAAAFGLCAQVFWPRDPTYARGCLLKGEQILDAARTHHPLPLTTTTPHSYYPEVSWRDDMELGAAELAEALEHNPDRSGLPHQDAEYYLEMSARWARGYTRLHPHGLDSLNLYDTSTLAHAELARAIEDGPDVKLAVNRRELIKMIARQLVQAKARAGKDTFGLGIDYSEGDYVPHALGLAVTAELYQKLTGSGSFSKLGQHSLDWVLGDNAWGSSFVVGAGKTFPHCLHSQIANLSGTLNGRPPIMAGATVDGPAQSDTFSGLGVPQGARRCPQSGGDSFRPFDGHGLRYADNVRAWPSVEPSDDYTALTLLAFSS